MWAKVVKSPIQGVNPAPATYYTLVDRPPKKHLGVLLWVMRGVLLLKQRTPAGKKKVLGPQQQRGGAGCAGRGGSHGS